jgi:hypothetical protein
MDIYTKCDSFYGTVGQSAAFTPTTSIQSYSMIDSDTPGVNQLPAFCVVASSYSEYAMFYVPSFTIQSDCTMRSINDVTYSINFLNHNSCFVFYVETCINYEPYTQPSYAPTPTYPISYQCVSRSNVGLCWQSDVDSNNDGVRVCVWRYNADTSHTYVHDTTADKDDLSITIPSSLTGLCNYVWCISFYNTYYCGDFGTGEYFTALPDPLSPPTLTAPNNAATGIIPTTTFSWNTVSGASYYEIQTATNSGFSANVEGPSTVYGTSIDFLNHRNSILPNTTYYWRVRTVDAYSQAGNWATSRSFTTLAAPATPTLVSPANGSVGQSLDVPLCWNSAANSDYYRVNLATNSNFSSGVQNSSPVYSTSTVLNSEFSVSQGITYWWRSRGENSGFCGCYSTCRCFTTLAGFPHVGLVNGILTQSTATNNGNMVLCSGTMYYRTDSECSNRSITLTTATGDLKVGCQ